MRLSLALGLICDFHNFTELTHAHTNEQINLIFTLNFYDETAATATATTKNSLVTFVSCYISFIRIFCGIQFKFACDFNGEHCSFELAVVHHGWQQQCEQWCELWCCDSPSPRFDPTCWRCGERHYVISSRNSQLAFEVWLFDILKQLAKKPALYHSYSCLLQLYAPLVWILG